MKVLPDFAGLRPPGLSGRRTPFSHDASNLLRNKRRSLLLCGFLIGWRKIGSVLWFFCTSMISLHHVTETKISVTFQISPLNVFPIKQTSTQICFRRHCLPPQTFLIFQSSIIVYFFWNCQYILKLQCARYSFYKKIVNTGSHTAFFILPPEFLLMAEMTGEPKCGISC